MKMNTETQQEYGRYFSPKPQIVKSLPKASSVADFSEIMIPTGNDGEYLKYQMINGSWHAIGTLEKKTPEEIEYDIARKTSNGYANNVIYPETYNAKGNGISDDTTAIRKALNAARGGTIVFSNPTYKITSKIDIDLNGKDIEIITQSGSVITSTATAVTNDEAIWEGAIRIYNGRTVKVNDIFLTATNTNAITYLNGILIEDCIKVILTNVTSTEAPFGGIRIVECSVASLVECNCNNNLYAGAIIQNCGRVTILGGDYSYNGLNFPANGYGINIAHRHGVSIDNEAVTILGVKANYNFRKGIDVHGGVSGSIMGNHVKGFGNSGIYALAEAGSDPGWNPAEHGGAPAPVDPLWLKHVRDWIISNNTIENDSAWYNARCSEAGISGFASGADGCAIFFGSYGDGLTLSPGAFNVHDNIITNCNVQYSRGHIFVFTNNDGSYYPKSIKIHSNTITEAGVNFTNDGVIHIVGVKHPEVIDIYSNTIVGDSGLVVYCNVGSLIHAHDNTINGTFTDVFNFDYDRPQRTKNNIYNGKPLPDMVSKDNGTFEYYVTTSGTTVNFDTIKVNAANSAGGGYDGGLVNCFVNIITSANTLAANYEFNAWAGNDNTNIFTGTKSVRKTAVIGNPETNAPSVSWVTDGNNRTLRIAFPAQYTGNHVSIKISGWRLHPKGA